MWKTFSGFVAKTVIFMYHLLLKLTRKLIESVTLLKVINIMYLFQNLCVLICCVLLILISCPK